MLLVVSVTTSDTNSDGIERTSSAGAGSHLRSCGSQRAAACLCSFAQVATEQPEFAAQHAGECQEQHSAQHACQKQLRAFLQLSSLASLPIHISLGHAVYVCFCELVLVVCMLCTALEREYRPFYGA